VFVHKWCQESCPSHIVIVHDSYLVYSKCSIICSFFLSAVKFPANSQWQTGHSCTSISTSSNKVRPDVILFSWPSWIAYVLRINEVNPSSPNLFSFDNVVVAFKFSLWWSRFFLRSAAVLPDNVLWFSTAADNCSVNSWIWLCKSF